MQSGKYKESSNWTSKRTKSILKSFFPQVGSKYYEVESLSEASQIMSSEDQTVDNMFQCGFIDVDGTITVGKKAIASSLPFVAYFLNNLQSMIDLKGVEKIKRLKFPIAVVTNRSMKGFKAVAWRSKYILSLVEGVVQRPVFSGMARQTGGDWGRVSYKQLLRFLSDAMEVQDHKNYKKIKIYHVFDTGNIITLLQDVFGGEAYFIKRVIKKLCKSTPDIGKKLEVVFIAVKNMSS